MGVRVPGYRIDFERRSYEQLRRSFGENREITKAEFFQACASLFSLPKKESRRFLDLICMLNWASASPNYIYFLGEING